MCMEDVRLGRQKYSRFSSVTLAVGVSKAIGAAPNRTAIRFGSPDAIPAINNNNAIVSPGIPGSTVPSIGFGFTVEAGSLQFTIEEDGDCVIGPWQVEANGAGCTIVILETFLDAR